jgi:hypothetical protein
MIAKRIVESNWQLVFLAATTTQGKAKAKEPTSKWKMKMLVSEHSPIRLLNINILCELPYKVVMHLVRHKIGTEHFVESQRPDRSGKPRDPDRIVQYLLATNAMGIIAISKERLCMKASLETVKAWRMILEVLRETEPELVSLCVSKCVSRNVCPEHKSCGRDFSKEREKYLSNLGK